MTTNVLGRDENRVQSRIKKSLVVKFVRELFFFMSSYAVHCV